MAFMVYQTEDGRVPAWEYYDATGLTPKVGMALTLTGGKLALATGTVKPQFICMRTQEAAVAEGAAPIPVVQVNDGITFEVPCAATIALGAKVSIADDGLSVISGSGAGTVVGTGDAGYVRVRF